MHCTIIFASKVVKENNDDRVLIVGAGVTLAEAVTAATHLQDIGISVRVIDPFTIKPIDTEALVHHAQQVGGRVITVEDHYAEGMYCTMLCYRFLTEAG